MEAQLPPGLPELFDTAQLAEAAAIERRLAQQMTYCLRAMGVLDTAGKRGNAILHRRVETPALFKGAGGTRRRRAWPVKQPCLRAAAWRIARGGDADAPLNRDELAADHDPAVSAECLPLAVDARLVLVVEDQLELEARAAEQREDADEQVEDVFHPFRDAVSDGRTASRRRRKV